MKFALAHEHYKFFQRHQVIEFENFFTPDQMTKIGQCVESGLLKRLGMTPRQLKQESPSDLFLAGRDLWREAPSLAKIILQKKWAEFAAELTLEKRLRFAFDQVITLKFPKSDIKEDPAFKHYTTKSLSLENSSCFQGLVCGLMIRLAGPEESQIVDSDALLVSPEPSIFPKKPGNASYFLSSVPFNFSSLESQAGTHQFLLIAYSIPKAVYVLQKNDPNTHFLKHLGYVFGDTLKDKLHPLVYHK